LLAWSIEVSASVAIFKHMAPTMFNLNCFHLQLPFIHRPNEEHLIGKKKNKKKQKVKKSSDHSAAIEESAGRFFLIWVLLFWPPLSFCLSGFPNKLIFMCALCAANKILRICEDNCWSFYHLSCSGFGKDLKKNVKKKEERGHQW